ncbi:hypothetical protein EPUS_06608 [Endocarpon pusillum Z07020]|uniref:Translationally-controlled tumor protein homolog n=1 Tax=Endocarpon pusillum (strain Z07020 / HMAS-L-300199) TaxID=1263415 RepID=U1HUU1_ENDPU|nr:uncharacterized protein EPUS_06608 [Endocarpon pusillum Z07020]ERF74430.1 hypothetical protein EPUS_06608 [Endocarpon pusillum Z07020]
MIIYKDIITGDEILSDTFKIIDVGDGLWEVDLKKVTKGGDNFVLEGANPSAEGEDAEESGDTENKQVLDIEDQFRLNKMEGGMDKKTFTSDLKAYIKRLNNKLKAEPNGETKSKEFQSGAAAALKKLSANVADYDIYMGESMSSEGMYILVNFREDGITPFATIWKHGLKEEKV